MTDKYFFEVVLDDTNNEFGEKFNPKNDKDVDFFERDLAEHIEEGGYKIISVTLKKVETIL